MSETRKLKRNNIVMMHTCIRHPMSLTNRTKSYSIGYGNMLNTTIVDDTRCMLANLLQKLKHRLNNLKLT